MCCVHCASLAVVKSRNRTDDHDHVEYGEEDHSTVQVRVDSRLETTKLDHKLQKLKTP